MQLLDDIAKYISLNHVAAKNCTAQRAAEMMLIPGCGIIEYVDSLVINPYVLQVFN